MGRKAETPRHVIYALHAGDFNYRYVGATSRPIGRLRDHKNLNCNPNVPVSVWVNSCPNVYMEILVECGKEELFESEKKFIKELREAGFDLLNKTDGGLGSPGWQPEEESRARIRRNNSGSGNPNFGKPMPEATKRALLAGYRAKQGGVSVYKKISETKRLKTGLTADDVRAIREDNSKTLDELSTIYGIGRSSIWRIKNRKTWADV